MKGLLGINNCSFQGIIMGIVDEIYRTRSLWEKRLKNYQARLLEGLSICMLNSLRIVTGRVLERGKVSNLQGMGVSG